MVFGLVLTMTSFRPQMDINKSVAPSSRELTHVLVLLGTSLVCHVFRPFFTTLVGACYFPGLHVLHHYCVFLSYGASRG